MKYFLTGFLFILMIMATVPGWCANTTAAGRILVEEDVWDFGLVPIDYKFIHYFQVKNTGPEELRIGKLVAGCDCTVGYTTDTLIPPGGTGFIKIIFDTKNYYGQNTRQLTVHSSDPENPTIELKYKSNIGMLPKLYRIEPKSLFFLPGQKYKDLKINNLSKEKVSFSITSEPDSLFTMELTEGTIGSGQTKLIRVVPVDDLPRGAYYSSFVVTFATKPEIKTSVPIKIVRY